MENLKQLALTYAINVVANNPNEEFMRDPNEFMELVYTIEGYLKEEKPKGELTVIGRTN